MTLEEIAEELWKDVMYGEWNKEEWAKEFISQINNHFIVKEKSEIITKESS